MSSIIRKIFHPVYIKLPIGIACIAVLIVFVIFLLRYTDSPNDIIQNSENNNTSDVDPPQEYQDMLITYNIQSSASEKEIIPQHKDKNKIVKAKKKKIEKSISCDINLLITKKQSKAFNADMMVNIREMTTTSRGEIIKEEYSKDTNLPLLVITKIPTGYYNSFINQLHQIGMFQEKDISSSNQYQNIILKIFILF